MSNVYLDYTGRDDVVAGGVRMIPITTQKGEFRVWTKRVGNNADTKLLLLHGGPAATHEYFEACDSYLPAAGIEYYYYDQLGSRYSDQPDDEELWEIDRFVDEVEQVRQALGLDRTSFFLLGHSWGGMLAIEYALRYQDDLRGLIISNMMSSIRAYNEYANTVLLPAMDQKALAAIRDIEQREDTNNPRYTELLVQHYYVDHILRMPPGEWPEPVNRSFAHLNQAIYVPMWGTSELIGTGKIAGWDRSDELSRIAVPTLIIGAAHDTMDPRHMEEMARKLPRGRYLGCPDGSHMAMYDDQRTYFAGLVDFLLSPDTLKAAASA
jgi:proline iminopeptidase